MKAMIFDADGTLLDSMGLGRRIDREFLEAHHYPYSTEISEQVETMSLQQSAVYFQQLLADREAISVRQITLELDALCAGAYETQIQAMPFVSDFLEAARRQEYRMCVATASKKAANSKSATPVGAAALFPVCNGCRRGGCGKNGSSDFSGLCQSFGKHPVRDLGV